MKTGRSSSNDAKSLPRGFCQFVLRPLYRLHEKCMGGDDTREGLDQILRTLEITLSDDEKLLVGKFMIKCVMGKFLPISKVRSSS